MRLLCLLLGHIFATNGRCVCCKEGDHRKAWMVTTDLGAKDITTGDEW